MINLGGIVDLRPTNSLHEEDVFTATSKETGTTSVFKTKDARDKAVKSGTHQMKKADKKDGEKKPGVNIFDKPKSDSSEKAPRDDKNRIIVPKELELKGDKYNDDWYQQKFSWIKTKEEQDFVTDLIKKSSPQVVDKLSNNSEKLKAAIHKQIDKKKGEPKDEPKSDSPFDKLKPKNPNLVDRLKRAQDELQQLEIDREDGKIDNFTYKVESGKLARIINYLQGELDKKETTMRIKNLLPESIINEGTRSQVGIINRNGKIASTYVHYDGYPRNMKPGLKKHMKNEKDVLQLIKRGGARGIYNDKDIEYYDDSKMKPVKGDFKDIAKYLDRTKDSWADFVYLYNMKDRKWYYADPYEDKELKKLF